MTDNTGARRPDAEAAPAPGAMTTEAPLVSRLHCQLTSTADSLHVKDLDSTNGVLVNGKRVTASPLREGDRLTVGRVEFTVSKSP